MIDPLERFLRIAAARPDVAAVIADGRTVSFGAFETMVRTIAHSIARAGDHPRVLVHLPPSAECYAAMFAALMAGGYYAPTNLSVPRARQELVISRFEPEVIVTTPELASTLSVAGATIVDATAGGATLEHARTPHDLAYVMFTSGSTGVPKGVMIPRSALAHYLVWALSTLAPSSGERWSQHPNVAFDLSVLDIYGALCGGATLCPIVTRRDRMLPADFVRRERIEIWNSVPSIIDLMVRAKQMTRDRMASVRVMTFCGEALLPRHVAAIFENCRDDVFVQNTYGPTEATVSCTELRLPRDGWQQLAGSSIALGTAIPGMELHLVEDDEIAIAGPQLARGYWRDADATARAFVTARIAGVDKQVYLTGDRGQIRDGQLYFVERRDHQVKIHGHRIELGDVDAAVQSCGFSEVCTVHVAGQLHAFVIAREDQLAGLRDRLRELLPDYAVPSEIHRLEHMPLTANDKIDRTALAAIVST